MSNGILWAFGDSFTAGNAKDMSQGMPFPLGNTIGKHRAYPDFIAKKLRLRTVNLAEGGHGNNDIVNTLIKASPNFNPQDDFIVIGLTTPFRNRIEATPLEALRHLLVDLGTIENFLNGYKYIITSAFCPLSPYYFKPEEIEFNVKNYVEWGKPNNTLIDICGDTWLDEKKINPVMAKGGEKFFSTKHAIVDVESNIHLESCSHPSTKGHRLIADTLMPYIDKVVNPKDNSYI